jgi:phosphate starvation-inducible PhoH-like protein
MRNPALTKQIQKDKAPKGEIKFNLTLNEEQKDAKAIILENDITVILGLAGSGKTLLACQIGLDMLFKKQVEKLIICRPTVTTGEELGFLPGDIKEKMDPFLQPIYSNMYQLYSKEKIDKMVESGEIEINAFAFMRGRTFLDSFVISDESQNLTHKDLEMIQGRIGKGSKMVICGDTTQIDLKFKKDSGLSFLRRIEEKVQGYRIVILKNNHRHPIVEKILGVYDEFRD